MDELKTIKSIVSINARLMINSILAGAVVTMFFITSSLQPKFLTENPLLAVQMVLTVPFLVTASMSNSFIERTENKNLWYNFGWLMFIIGYAFTLNSIGILIRIITSVNIALIFYAFSFLLPIIYSILLVKFERLSIKERLIKDSLFLGLQLVLGVFVVLGLIG